MNKPGADPGIFERGRAVPRIPFLSPSPLPYKQGLKAGRGSRGAM